MGREITVPKTVVRETAVQASEEIAPLIEEGRKHSGRAVAKRVSEALKAVEEASNDDDWIDIDKSVASTIAARAEPKNIHKIALRGYLKQEGIWSDE